MNKKLLLATSAATLIFASACGEKSEPVASQDAEPLVKPAALVDFQPTGVIAGTLPEIAVALNSDQVSSEALVQAYLDRIALIDTAGPTLQSVLTINPDALTEAKKLDQMRAAGNVMGALHGVPILLKDNIGTVDNMPTTAGALVLKDNYAKVDSPLVAGLRASGAVILGKTNLSQ